MMAYLEGLTDPRQTKKVLHNFIETIMLVICAVIAGCDAWEDIADYCRVKEGWFREKLGLKLQNGIPSHDTMERVFGMLNPEEFQKRFMEWVEKSCGKQAREVINVDGKTMRGSAGKAQKPIHMVSAWASKARAVFGQMAVEEKTNEITAALELLELLDIENTIITADAMSCQKEIVKTISEKGADYVIGLKDNQPTLCQETRDYFVSALETPQFYPHVNRTVTLEKGHGRTETRRYYLCTDPDFLKLYPEWINLRSVGMMKSTVIQNETTTEETHYYISSLVDVKEFADAARRHWGIENSLHYCLDVTFREDRSRMRRNHSAENFAVVKHIVLNILKNMNDKLSVARRRRSCSYDDAYLEKVLMAINCCEVFPAPGLCIRTNSCILCGKEKASILTCRKPCGPHLFFAGQTRAPPERGKAWGC